MCKIIKYLDYARFFQDCFLMSVIFIIGMIGLFHTCKGLRKYKEILKNKEFYYEQPKIRL
ncbi:hypothetical protein [Campylobacter coli]|uniref:hypothetical protein n=1 Tax=Campylobacter coli TaxID=195 RepID=UPI0025AF4B3F|nr:hypothetical protein [Campylobacter coli]ECO3663947.1 hypothetical protein [Campylobacter coli]MDN2725595.1 hypothetical protein [Campylobacter coli]HEG0296600.1 hypothetical protein [Campylobacter coli]